jgi:RHS repeat-associated protein
MLRTLNALLLAFLFVFVSSPASASVQPSAQTITYFHNDISGSPLAATDATGNVVWKESYRPYGEKLRNEPASRSDTNKIGYAGSPFDAGTGLSYMGARYYDPVIGRFMGIDPVGFNPNNIHTFNRYAYANNNPYKFVDSDGRDAVIVFSKTGGINITIPTTFSGPGATSANVSAIKSDIAARWSGTYTINGKATTVNVSIVDGPSNGKHNTITLTTGPTSLDSVKGASYVKNGNSGEWNINSPGWKFGEPAHEAGHLLGERDYYKEGPNDANGNRTTVPFESHVDNLMGRPNGSTNSGNMDVILKSPSNLTIRE